MKNTFVIPNALAVTTAVVFVVCFVLVSLFPDLSFTIAKSWLHGFEMSKAADWNLTVNSFILGLVSSTITAWIIGYIYVLVYKKFSK